MRSFARCGVVAERVAETNPDGGDGSLTMVDAGRRTRPATGVHAFDVVAVLRADGSTNLPPTNRFTLVLDVSALRMIAGGNGRGAIVGVTTDDGRTFRSAGAFAVGDGTGRLQRRQRMSATTASR